jgi:hypothetical protein
LAGCSKQADDGLNPQQQQTADRLDAVAKKSDGDWNKLSASDKAFFIKTAGDENGGRMLLLAKAGKLGYHGSGPPPAPPTIASKH